MKLVLAAAGIVALSCNDITGPTVEQPQSLGVQRAAVTGYDSQAEVIGRAATIGAIATLSHGFFLVFTAPAWIATGALGTRAQARAPVRTAGPHDLPALASFARFPQGLPPGLALETLRWRP